MNNKNNGCSKCRKMKLKKMPLFKKKKAKCFVCKKSVKRVLDLHHTKADLCGLKCETKYWLDILY
jgi:hypothetical protein